MIDDIIPALGLAHPDAAHLLRSYCADLIRFNRSQNLISRQDPARRAAALIGESCLAANAQNIKENEYIIDLGSGAGIPGIPTAICCPTVQVVLLDRRGGRCEFLRREVRILPLPGVEVVEGDAAAVGERAGRLDRVLLKAVAPPAEALRLARPYLRPKGRAVVYREASWNPAEAGDDWQLARRSTLDADWMERGVGIFEFTSV